MAGQNGVVTKLQYWKRRSHPARISEPTLSAAVPLANISACVLCANSSPLRTPTPKKPLENTMGGQLLALSRTRGVTKVYPRIFGRHVYSAVVSFTLVSLLGLVLMGAVGCSNLGSKGVGLQPSDASATSDVAVRSMPVVPGRRARVFIFAAFGEKCEPIAEPRITITEPPTKGDVSFVPGQETNVRYSAQGTCVGRTTTGTGIYYTARAGAGRSGPFLNLGQTSE